MTNLYLIISLLLFMLFNIYGLYVFIFDKNVLKKAEIVEGNITNIDKVYNETYYSIKVNDGLCPTIHLVLGLFHKQNLIGNTISIYKIKKHGKVSYHHKDTYKSGALIWFIFAWSTLLTNIFTVS